MKLYLVIASVLFAGIAADVSHILNDDYYTAPTPQPPPKPYVFSYTAGRYPGHTDRTHSEVSDGSGTVRGAFSYVDPRNQIRVVEYVADENGFHPSLSHNPQPPKQTEAVQRAADRHAYLYNKIASEHANPQSAPIKYPKDTVSVINAKEKHFTLYEQIAEDHARIAAEREAERLAFEATSEKNDLVEQYYHHND